jgi:O-antigen/teichoic acid export membrane protein
LVGLQVTDITPESASTRFGLVTNSLGMVVAKFVAMGLGLLFWLVAAQETSRREVGLVGALVATTLLCVQLAQRGTAQGLVSVIGGAQRHEHLVVVRAARRTVLVGGVVVSAVAVLLGLLSTGDLGELSRHPLAVGVFAMAVTSGALGSVQDQLSMAHGASNGIVVRNAANGAVSVIAAIIASAVHEHPGWLLLFTCWTAGSLTAALIGEFQSLRSVTAHAEELHSDRLRALRRELESVGRRNFVLTFLERLPGLMLPLIVTAVLSAADTAVWYTTWQIAWAVFVIPIALGTGLYADVTADGGGDRPVRARVRVAIKVALGLVVGAGALALMLSPVVLPLIGKSYADDGLLPLSLLIVAAVPLTIAQVYYGLCRAEGRFREATRLAAAVTVLSLVSATTAAFVWGSLVPIAAAWLGANCLGAAVAVRRLMLITDPPSHDLPSGVLA